VGLKKKHGEEKGSTWSLSGGVGVLREEGQKPWGGEKLFLDCSAEKDLIVRTLSIPFLPKPEIVKVGSPFGE